MSVQVQGFSNQQSKVSFEDTSVAFSNHSDGSLRKTYWIFALMNQNLLVKLGTFMIKIAIKWHFPVKKLIKNTIFNQFCGGESIEDCQNSIENLAKGKVSTILDYSVEGEDSEVDFEKTKNEILKTIQKAAKEPMVAFAVFKVSGLGSVAILEKKQSGIALKETEKNDFENIKKRVEILCKEADKLNVKLFFDAEESWIQQTIDELCIEMMKRFNRQKTIIFNTYQMYKIDSIDHIKSIIQNADNEGFKVGVKLVRGAYMERERSRAESQNYQDPIQPNKAATDADFDEALVLLLKNRNLVNLWVRIIKQVASYVLKK
jgi:proline dehydrogenase